MSTLSIANLAGRKPRPLSGTAKIVLVVLIALGAIAFVVRSLGDEPVGAWTSLLTNYMLFTQLGIVGLVFACIGNITNSTWMRPLKRIGESFTMFLPISLVLLVVLFFGKDFLWQWGNEELVKNWSEHHQHVLHHKHAWLNVPFFWGRQFAIVIVFNLFAFIYRRVSLRPDLGAIAEANGSKIEGWQGLEAEVARSQTIQRYMAPVICLTYAVFWSVHSWDMIMSIDWLWFSAMLGGWQFSSGLLALFALMNLYATYYRKNAYLDDLITKQQYHDLGKLMFGFGIFWAYLMWAQYLPIWYGNLPEETFYIILRVHTEPWRTLSLSLAFIIWLIPFWVLMPAGNKMNPSISGAMALLILVGLWLERYDLITATLSPGKIPLGITDLVLTLGFAAAFILVTSTFLSKNPVLTVTDPYLKTGGDHH
jgi:hypothetical protein